VEKVGIYVPHEGILRILSDYDGVTIDKEDVKFKSDLVLKALNEAKYVLPDYVKNNMPFYVQEILMHKIAREHSWYRANDMFEHDPKPTVECANYVYVMSGVAEKWLALGLYMQIIDSFVAHPFDMKYTTFVYGSAEDSAKKDKKLEDSFKFRK